MVILTCDARISLSLLLRIRDDIPEKSVGAPKMRSALMDAKGLALWRRESPKKRITPSDFL